MNTRAAQSSPTDELDTVPDTSSPAYASRRPLARAFDRFASLVTRWAGSPTAFCMAVVTVAAWVITGPIFHYSDKWQLVINTGTTIVTFLMVCLIQNTQNHDARAVHLKLDELIRATKGARNALVGAEEMADDELAILQAGFERLREEVVQRRAHRLAKMKGGV